MQGTDWVVEPTHWAPSLVGDGLLHSLENTTLVPCPQLLEQALSTGVHADQPPFVLLAKAAKGLKTQYMVNDTVMFDWVHCIFLQYSKSCVR